MLHHPAHQPGGTPHRQTIRMGPACQPDVLHGNLLMQSGGHAHQHARGLHRLHKKAVDILPIQLLQPKGDAARRAADAAGQIHEQRVRPIHGDIQTLQLYRQPSGRHGVAQKQVHRLLVVHKIAARVRVRQTAALFDRLAVVGAILHHRHAAASQQVLFPLPGVCRHMDHRMEPQGRGHDADAHPQVACGAYLDGIAAEEIPAAGVRQLVIAVPRHEQAVLQGQVLRMLEHLINAAPGLDRAGNGQMAVLLEQQAARKTCRVFFIQPGVHTGDLGQGGLDQAVPGSGLRKAELEKGREALEAAVRVRDVLGGKGDILRHFPAACILGVQPEYLRTGPDLVQHRRSFGQCLNVHHVSLLVFPDSPRAPQDVLGRSC